MKERKHAKLSAECWWAPENNVMNQYVECAFFHWGLACNVEQLHNLSFAYSVSSEKCALCSNLKCFCFYCRANTITYPEIEHAIPKFRNLKRHQFSSKTHLHHPSSLFIRQELFRQYQKRHKEKSQRNRCFYGFVFFFLFFLRWYCYCIFFFISF